MVASVAVAITPVRIFDAGVMTYPAFGLRPIAREIQAPARNGLQH
jgi:hypothetical protein